MSPDPTKLPSTPLPSPPPKKIITNTIYDQGQGKT
jgi:hypothetical protein